MNPVLWCTLSSFFETPNRSIDDRGWSFETGFADGPSDDLGPRRLEIRGETDTEALEAGRHMRHAFHTGTHPMKVCRNADSLQERKYGRRDEARVAEQLCNGLQIHGPGCKSRLVLHLFTDPKSV